MRVCCRGSCKHDSHTYEGLLYRSGVWYCKPCYSKMKINASLTDRTTEVWGAGSIKCYKIRCDSQSAYTYKGRYANNGRWYCEHCKNLKPIVNLHPGGFKPGDLVTWGQFRSAEYLSEAENSKDQCRVLHNGHDSVTWFSNIEPKQLEAGDWARHKYDSRLFVHVTQTPGFTRFRSDRRFIEGKIVRGCVWRNVTNYIPVKPSKEIEQEVKKLAKEIEATTEENVMKVLTQEEIMNPQGRLIPKNNQEALRVTLTNEKVFPDTAIEAAKQLGAIERLKPEVSPEVFAYRSERLDIRIPMDDRTVMIWGIGLMVFVLTVVVAVVL